MTPRKAQDRAILAAAVIAAAAMAAAGAALVFTVEAAVRVTRHALSRRRRRAGSGR